MSTDKTITKTQINIIEYENLLLSANGSSAVERFEEIKDLIYMNDLQEVYDFCNWLDNVLESIPRNIVRAYMWFTDQERYISEIIRHIAIVRKLRH